MRLLILFALLIAGHAAAGETQYQRHLRAYATATGGDRTTIELLCETYGFSRRPTAEDRRALALCVQREVKQLELMEALREAQDRELMYRSITQPIVPTR